MAQRRFVFRTRLWGAAGGMSKEGVVGELPTGPGMQQGEPLEFDWERGQNALGSFRWAMKLSGTGGKPRERQYNYTQHEPGKAAQDPASLESWQRRTELPGKKVPAVSGEWDPLPSMPMCPTPAALGGALLPFKQSSISSNPVCWEAGEKGREVRHLPQDL